MNHKQILDTLAAASLVKALEFDIAYATNRNMLGPKWDKPDPASVSKAVISGVLAVGAARSMPRKRRSLPTTKPRSGWPWRSCFTNTVSTTQQ